MKYFLAFLTGLIFGAAVFFLGLVYNPFIDKPGVSPLAVTRDPKIELTFSAVPDDALLYTDNGDSIVTPHPERVAELWEPAVNKTRIWVTMLQDSRGTISGVGIKFSTQSEDTALLKGEAMANSMWHVYLPDRGTFLIDQTENYWAYLRDIVIPARRSSVANWRGNFYRVMTAGPGALGTGRVTGGSGRFNNLSGEAVESLSARGYSATVGPVSMTGSLTVAIPQAEVAGTEQVSSRL
jgi:hypothetical protein